VRISAQPVGERTRLIYASGSCRSLRLSELRLVQSDRWLTPFLDISPSYTSGIGITARLLTVNIWHKLRQPILRRGGRAGAPCLDRGHDLLFPAMPPRCRPHELSTITRVPASRRPWSSFVPPGGPLVTRSGCLPVYLRCSRSSVQDQYYGPTSRTGPPGGSQTPAAEALRHALNMAGCNGTVTRAGRPAPGSATEARPVSSLSCATAARAHRRPESERHDRC
jgi:hypothetical protein